MFSTETETLTVADPGGFIGFHGNSLFNSDKLFSYIHALLMIVVEIYFVLLHNHYS